MRRFLLKSSKMASGQLANALPIGAEDQINPVFGGTAPAAELLAIAAGSDLRIATQPEWSAATITPYGHAKLTLLVLAMSESASRMVRSPDNVKSTMTFPTNCRAAPTAAGA